MTRFKGCFFFKWTFVSQVPQWLSSPISFKKEPLKIIFTCAFYKLDALLVTPKHWRNIRALTQPVKDTDWLHPFDIHHQNPNGQGDASFIPPLSDKMHGTQSVTQRAQADLVSHVTDRMVSTWWNRVMSSGSVSEVHQPCDRTVSSASLSRAVRRAAEIRKSRSASVFCCWSDSIPCPAHQTTCTSSRFSIIHTLLLLLLLQPFNGLFSRTTWVSRYQKGKNSLDLNEARDDEDFGRQ